MNWRVVGTYKVLISRFLTHTIEKISQAAVKKEAIMRLSEA